MLQGGDQLLLDQNGLESYGPVESYGLEAQWHGSKHVHEVHGRITAFDIHSMYREILE